MPTAGEMSPIAAERTVQDVTMLRDEEAALWARACSGEGRAFALLFDAHVDRVFRHVLRLVPTAADADEVASAAFFELWRKRAAVRTVDGSVLPWLLVTATNLARNSSRGSRRYAAVVDRLPRGSDLDDGDLADRAYDAARRRALLGALRKLSTTDATLITLTALEGYPLGEAAQVADVTVVAARARILRARRRLHGLLAHAPELLAEGVES